MSLSNCNISPLPFYDNIALQSHRKDYAFGHISPVLNRIGTLLPFQFISHKLADTKIQNCVLWDFNTNTGRDITTEISAHSRIELVAGVNGEAYRLFKCYGSDDMPALSTEGLYYIELITNSGSRFYSEIFSVFANASNYIKLKYRASRNFSLYGGEINFDNGFAFTCYLPTQIGRPEYSFKEEVTERLGYRFIESQVSKKVYKFTFVAPEYLCDALRIVQLCDSVQITDNYYDYMLTSFSMEVDWQEQGDLAAVECECETDNIILNISNTY